jgi:hypothetical protein
MANIGIVGGGIAGLYCARELLSQRHSVTLCECLDHLGGRIETQDLHGFKAECGPMRFELKIEPRLMKLATELNIEFADFTPPHSGSAEFPKYCLQPNEMSAMHTQAAGKTPNADTLAILSHHTSALDLLKYGIYRIFHSDPQNLGLSLEDVVSGGKSSKICRFADSLSDTDYDRFRTKQNLDGIRLYTLGFWNALSRVLSSGAIAKIRETGTFYHLLPENPSASEWSIFWLRLFRSDADLSTIKEGVETIVKRLEGGISGNKRLKILTRTTIERIVEDQKTEKLRLGTASGLLAQVFDHVILAIPAAPLKSLGSVFPREIRRYVDGVIPFPLLKVFVVIKNPWWAVFPQPHEGAHLVPTREVHYFSPPDGSTDLAMIMFYTDRPATAFWHTHTRAPHDSAQIGRSPQLERELALQISQLLPSQSKDSEAHLKRVEESILSFAIRDWSEPPFGAACHAWAPHIDVPEALTQLKAFSLRGPSGKKNVHVCGEAYSDYQGFIEGALRTAADVLTTIK